MKANWRVFIVAHDRVHEEMYARDPLWSPDNYSFLNVGTGSLTGPSSFQVIQQLDLPNARSLGKHWAESEGVYNIYRSGLHRDYDFVGFLQYDKELRLRRRRLGILPGASNITARANAALAGKDRWHVSFETHGTTWDFNQRIMADESRSGTSFTIDDILVRPRINLCSCFLIDTKSFDKMMGFFGWVVDSGHLEMLDPQRRHRLQGGLAERYFGIFLLLEYSSFTDLDLHHRNLKPVN